MDWDLSVQMINATVQIEHQRPDGGRRVSTGFLVQAPWPDGTPRTVLVTAAHALEPAEGAQVRIGWRFENPDASWRFGPQPAPLAVDGRDLWVRHPERDIAVLEITAPPEFAAAAVPLAWLADETPMQALGAGPGQALMSLGYPRGLSANRAGFPILREVRVASWPLTPAAAFPTFLIDGFMFPGNSGGPVYVERGPLGHPLIVGVVTQQVDQEGQAMGVGVVTQAIFVRETIALLDLFALTSAGQGREPEAA